MLGNKYLPYCTAEKQWFTFHPYFLLIETFKELFGIFEVGLNTILKCLYVHYSRSWLHKLFLYCTDTVLHFTQKATRL